MLVADPDRELRVGRDGRRVRHAVDAATHVVHRRHHPADEAAEEDREPLVGAVAAAAPPRRAEGKG